jgi:hypothetical protein
MVVFDVEMVGEACDAIDFDFDCECFFCPLNV